MRTNRPSLYHSKGLPLFLVAAILLTQSTTHGFVPPIPSATWQPPSTTRTAFVTQPITFPTTTMTTSRTTTTTKLPRLSMVKYEDLLEKLPSPAVVDAVDAMSEKRVVASDVAVAAGVSLSQARKDLVALASLSAGDIAVDTDGELIYQFPRNLKSVLAQNSAKYQLVSAFRKAWPGIFWFVRVSFGITLLVSLFAIFSTIIFLQSSSSSSSSDDRDDRRQGGGGMSFGGSYIWGPSPLDIFFWNRPYGYYATADPFQKPDEMGFLPSVFSYVFGDGNPNAQLEEKRLALVANVIRANKGAVTAEQLAPFCDDAPSPADYEQKTYVDEVRILILLG